MITRKFVSGTNQSHTVLCTMCMILKLFLKKSSFQSKRLLTSLVFLVLTIFLTTSLATDMRGFPLSFKESNRPEQVTVKLVVKKPPNAVGNASLTLMIFGVEDLDGSQIEINGAGPIPLVRHQVSTGNDRQLVPITVTTPVDWWNDGRNTLRFVNRGKGGYRIDSASVTFETIPSGLPIDLQGSNLPDQAIVYLVVEKPAAAVGSATLTLVVFDADNPNEGQLEINGAGPIPLFGHQASFRNGGKFVYITFKTSVDWWNDGRNMLRFVHSGTDGYRIESVSVEFELPLVLTKRTNLPPVVIYPDSPPITPDPQTGNFEEPVTDPDEQEESKYPDLSPMVEEPELALDDDATTESFELSYPQKEIKVIMIDSAPNIDGRHEESFWKTNQKINKFWVKQEKRAATEPTEVTVLQDEEFLYFGFRCYDSQPEQIVAQKTRRDSGLGFDDQAIILLDSFHNHRNLERFSINSLGTQNHVAGTGSADKIEWKGDWQAAASLTDYGWSAELAIPFSMLNYGADQSVFGVNFTRYQNRLQEWSHWTDITPQSKPEEMGHINGLELPQKRPEKVLTFMPYVLAGKNIPDKEGDVHDYLWSLGGDIRYQPTQNTTGLLSINPDFSQLESQITDIDFSDNEKLVDDPRPFFQEGSTFFVSDGDELYFNSPRVPNFDAGIKYFSQVSEWQLGSLATIAPEDRIDTVTRLGYELNSTTTLSTSIVTTEGDALDNQLVMTRFDGRMTSGLNYKVDAAYTNTDGKDAEVNEGIATLGSLGFNGDYWWANTDFDYFEREFFSANGIQNADTVDTQSIGLSTGYNREFLNDKIRAVDFSISFDARDTIDGEKQKRAVYLGGSVELPQQITFGAFYFDQDYRPIAKNARGEFRDTLRHDHYWTGSIDFGTRSSYVGAGLSLSDGFLGGDDYRYLTGYFWIKPVKRISLELNFEELDNFGEFTQAVISGSWDITNVDRISFRYIDSDFGDYKRLAYGRTVRKGMDVFAVLNEELEKDLEASIKLLWTF